jgi:hypothetical protein
MVSFLLAFLPDLCMNFSPMLATCPPHPPQFDILNKARFLVLIAVTIKSTVFWAVISILITFGKEYKF